MLMECIAFTDSQCGTLVESSALRLEVLGSIPQMELQFCIIGRVREMSRYCV